MGLYQCNVIHVHVLNLLNNMCGYHKMFWLFCDDVACVVQGFPNCVVWSVGEKWVWGRFTLKDPVRWYGTF